MLSILREDILPLTRRKVEGNLMVFKTFQRCQGENRSRPRSIEVLIESKPRSIPLLSHFFFTKPAPIF